MVYLGRVNAAFGKCCDALQTYWGSLKVLTTIDEGLIQFVWIS